MNFLSQIYTDSCYKSYLDNEPPFLVAVVSGKRLCISEGLSRMSNQSSLFHIKYFPDLRSLPTKQKAAGAPLPNALGVLKSDWCTRHLHSRFSCVIFSLDWETVSDVAMDEIGNSSMWDQLLAWTRTLRSKIIVALATEKCSNEGEDVKEKLETLQRVLKQRLGDDFNELIILFKLGMERESAEHLYHMLKKTSTAYHMEELARIRNKPPEPNYRAVRLGFKAGWHSLVVRDLGAAVKHFTNAYNCLRDVAPPQSPMELRMCGTVIIMHLLNAAKALSDVSFEDLYYGMCEDHIVWLGQVTPSTGENFTMVQFLKPLLIAECHYWLAKNTCHAVPVASMGHLCACMFAYEDALKVNRSLETSAQKTVAPVLIGVECCSEAHVNICSLSGTSDALTKRVGELLSECACLTVPTVELLYTSARLNVMLRRTDEALYSLEMLWEHGVKSYEGAKVIHGLLMELSKSVPDELVEKCSREVTLSYASLSFGPGAEEIQRRFRDSFAKMISTCSLDSFLSYPHKGYYAPFNIFCGFSEVHGDDSMHELVMVFRTHSIDNVNVDSLCVNLSRMRDNKLDSWATQTSVDRSVELCSCNSSSVSALFDLREPGVYYCSRVQGRVKCGEICLNVEWNFDDTSVENYFLQHDQFKKWGVSYSQCTPWVCVAEPICHIEVHAPDYIVGVEGEVVEVDVVIDTNSDLRDDTSFVLTHLPAVYEFVGCDAGNCSLKKRCDGGKGYVSLLLNNLPPILCGSPSRLTMRYKCNRAGKYVIPVTFCALSNTSAKVEITKNVQAHISCPFIPSYTLFKSIPWTMEAQNTNDGGTSLVTLEVPEVSSPFVRSGSYTLLRPQDYINEDLSTLHGNRSVTLYGAFTNREKCGDINFSKGETIVVVMTMECRAVQGLTLSSFDAVVSDNVVLLSLAAGTLPFQVDYMESFTVTAKLRVLRTGRVSLGFVRMLISPGSSTQRIISDVSLPEVETDDHVLELTLECPSTVASGSYVTLVCNVVNKTAIPQSCQLTLERNGEFFLVGGIEQWNFPIGPLAVYSTRIVLKPLAVGVLQLPSLHLRHSSGVSFGTVSSFQFDSQKICVLTP
ncbi:hypothetical protein, conserved [Trypanosoma brucei gambiense DAL972]|uniref:Trafficking protein particle complex subunit 11 domain-containing protein n=1 Tax=Trypanosoma brucei gambiense (strain MHOM/CI/86/DAL972) TaxID=679716 RepID=C9ZVH9_TRYB9|nr:hypothetical protein, conserved [Trypanosoma brucei gambiense DAL972]CBH13417.1 hypothetical protein, conserved [Trypanosoma brucei gambiense DAL972]|eukprot:XP_011775694.1 hypothetical protein, conserved [Trypanosoma brucei gambiense DAL972]